MQMTAGLRILFGRLYDTIPSDIRGSRLYQRVASGAIWSLVGGTIAQGATLAATFPIARILGISDYGEYGAIQRTIVTFITLAGPVLAISTTKELAANRHRDSMRCGRIVAVSLMSGVIASALCAIVIFAAAPWLSEVVLKAKGLEFPLKVSAGVMAVSAFNAIQQGILAGIEDFRGIAYLNLVRGGITVPATILGAIIGRVDGILIGNFIAGILAVAIGHQLVTKALKRAGIEIDASDLREERRTMLEFSMPTLLSSAAIMASTWFATVVLVREPDGFVEMGVFNAANQWYMAILFIPTLVTRPALSMLSQAWERDGAEFRTILMANLLLTGLTSAVAAAVVASLSGFIMKGYGGGFHSGSVVLEALAIAALFSSVSGVVGSAIWSTGRMWHSLAINGLWATLFCTACVVFRHLGALGIALAYVTAYTIHAVVLGVYARMLVRKSFRRGVRLNPVTT